MDSSGRENANSSSSRRPSADPRDGITPSEANMSVAAANYRSPKTPQSVFNRTIELSTSTPCRLEEVERVQQKDVSKSPNSNAYGAHMQLFNKLKREHSSMSHSKTEREHHKVKHNGTQKSPRSGSTCKIKSPCRSQSTLLPYLYKVGSSWANLSPNASREVCAAASPPGRFGCNKMATVQSVNLLKDNKENCSLSTPEPVCVSSSSPNATSLKEGLAAPPLRAAALTKSSENVHQAKRAVVHSKIMAREVTEYYSTPQRPEKFCDSLTMPQRQLFDEYFETEYRAPKGAFPFKKNKFRFDYLPALDNFPRKKGNLGSSKQKKVPQRVTQHIKSKPSTLDSIANKCESITDEPIKQSRNILKLEEEQYLVLHASFTENPYPNAAQLTNLAEDFGVSVPKLKTYFGGRRRTLRRKMSKQGIQIMSKEEMCLYAQDPKRPAWGELLFKQGEAEDEDYHIGKEASSGKYFRILCDKGLDCVKNY